MIRSDRFPFQSHRTLAEVEETRRLRERLARIGARRLLSYRFDLARLRDLDVRAAEPDQSSPDGAA